MFIVPGKNRWFVFLKNIFFICIALSACTTPRGYQSNKPFVFKNYPVELKGGNFSNEERKSLEQKLFTLLDDSMKTRIKDFAFLFHTIKNPPAYDSAYAALSARNMKNTLIHMGYYRAKDTFKADTAALHVLTYHFPFSFKNVQQQRVSVKYTITAGPPTLIDTFSYRLKDSTLQYLALQTKQQSLLIESNPVAKTNVLGEISRLVELYRNNGYYKFTPDDLKVLGDTTIEALTNIFDDPFENLRKLAEANQQRNKPTIKLAMIINPLTDSSRLKKYFIDNIFIYPDFTAADVAAVPKYTDTVKGYIIKWYHKRLFKNDFLLNNMYFKKGSLYSQEEYAKTANSFSRAGNWQNVNVQVSDVKDSSGKINILLQLVPGKKYGFESNIEASYSASSNINNVSVANAGNLLGFSGNVSLQNRNVWRQGIKWTHAIRAGIELNLNAERRSNQRINSSEISYNTTLSVPKSIFPWLPKNIVFPVFGLKQKNMISRQSFINLNLANTNRIALFKLNSIGASLGWGFDFSRNRSITIKLVNLEYTNLYNRSTAFDETLINNPFLRYSFNTALVLGSSISFSNSNILGKKSTILTTNRINIEHSGFPFNYVKFLQKDLRKFIKIDAEKIFTTSNPNKRAYWTFRLFGGVGFAFGKDTTLPFFKQYYAGGANSMRGWPIRGIGPGSKSLAPYDSRFLSDRTGDLRLEINGEYRYNIAQIIPNTLVLKGVLFFDAGNVWNIRNTDPLNRYDSTQFKFKNLYKEFGLTLGTGFRFDFNYVVLRADFGFRFKRPELDKNDGWKAPSIGFNDLFKKFFKRGDNDEYRIWRYENFNFTIGLNYPF